MSRFVAVLLLIASSTAFAKRARRYDVRTDAELHAAIEDAAGISISKASEACTRRMDGPFAKVILVGSFAHDYGCRERGYFADGYYVASRDASAPALLAAGWTDKSKRAALARTWVDVLDQRPLDTATVRVLADGSVQVEGWRTLPVGMRPERTSVKIRATFQPGGTFTKQTLETKVDKI